MKRARWLILAAAAAVALMTHSVCASAPFVRYDNRTYGFSVNYPSDWVMREGLMGTAVIFLSPLENKNDAFMENINIVVQDLTQPVTLEEYVAVSVQQLRQIVVDGTILSIRRSQLDGRPCAEIIYTGRQVQFTLKWLCRVVLVQDRAYSLTYTAEMNRFDAWLDTVDQIFDSFKVL